MAILRKVKKEKFTVIDNAIFYDYGLSYKAKGLLCQMLSLPDGWSFSIEGLARLAADGKASVTSALNELKEAGYFYRRQVREGNRISGIEYVISEAKLNDFQELENQHLENQHLGNQPQLNTNISTTNSSTTKDICIERAKNKIPPTIEMVEDYINENGYNVDAHAFIDYYESKGWIVGKAKMKDWQATVRNWNRNDYNKTSSNPFAEMLRKGEF